MFRFSSVVSASGAGSMGPSVVSGSGAGVGPVSSAAQEGNLCVRMVNAPSDLYATYMYV